MIGQIITDPKTGKPSKEHYSKLSPSSYRPPKEVMDLWCKIQQDYQIAYLLQHRSFKEFDGVSLLDRARMDQETFAAYVGAEWVPQHKKWRWKGRKNTARNKMIAICARMLAGILFPTVHAHNELNEEDTMTARVMRIRIEDHLRKAGYEVKFLFMIMSALVNPAVFIQVEWVEMMQKIKNGPITEEILNEALSGLVLNIRPIDEIMLPDVYSGTGNLKKLHCIISVRRIPYDEVAAKWKGKFYSTTDKNRDGSPKDLFDYVQAGMTRVFLTGQENQELFDIEWTEADLSYVQEIIAYYPYEDLEVPVVGGIAMVNEENVYNKNPFTHRRFTLTPQGWKSFPVLPIVMGGFEPLDPTGRFAYYKSAAFKEYWDDKAINRMHQLAFDGSFLDIIKPTIISGVVKPDGTMMVPGGVFGVPPGAQVQQYSLGPNLKAAFDLINQYEKDMADSTNMDPVPDAGQAGISAAQINAAQAKAKMFISIFALFVSDMVKQIGDLTVDCEVNYGSVCQLDDRIPGHLSLIPKTTLIKGNDHGKDVTHKITFTDKHMGRKYTPKQIEDMEWKLYNSTGKNPSARFRSKQRNYEVNPYQYARTVYNCYVDPEEIMDKSTGAEQNRAVFAFNMLTDPRVAPFVDMQAVVTDFAIDKFGGQDPDRYKKKGGPTPPPAPGQGGQNNEMAQSIMNQNPTPQNFKLGGAYNVPGNAVGAMAH